MVLALPFLQAVLKMFFLPNAPLLNFMRALAYGFALAGAVVVAFFIGWLCSDESHAFSVKVPALCTDLQLKPAVRSHPTCAARLRVTPLRSLPTGSPLSSSSDCARNVLLRSQSSNCLGAILSWAAPALAGGWSIMLAGISFFISRSHEESGLAAASKLLPIAVRVNACCYRTVVVYRADMPNTCNSLSCCHLCFAVGWQRRSALCRCPSQTRYKFSAALASFPPASFHALCLAGSALLRTPYCSTRWLPQVVVRTAL